MVGVGCEGEAGRPPGALANSARAVRRESLGDPGYRGATESSAALSGAKWSPTISWTLDTPSPKASKSPSAAPGRICISVRRQISPASLAESAASRRTPAFPPRRARPRCAGPISEEHANPGESSPAPLPAGSRCSAPCPRRPPGRRARTTPPRRPSARRDRAGAHRLARRAAIGKATKRRGDRQRELSSGAEPRMRGDGVRDDELFAVSRPRLSAMRSARRAPRSRSSPKTSKLWLREAERGSRTRRWRDQSSRIVGRDPRRNRENPNAGAPPS